MLTDNDVIEFQKLFNKQFGVVLSQDTAYRKLTMLVRQIELIYKPINLKRYEQYVNKDDKDDKTKEYIPR
jgi:hypothetical protein